MLWCLLRSPVSFFSRPPAFVLLGRAGKAFREPSRFKNADRRERAALRSLRKSLQPMPTRQLDYEKAGGVKINIVLFLPYIIFLKKI